MIISKASEEQRICYGWASVATEKGVPVVDLQGDVLDPAELELASSAFMADVRAAKLNHDNNGPIGEVLHSLPLTAEIAKALGISCDREGWIVGIKIHNEAVWQAVKSGRLSMLSIGATAIREEM
nr:XkdF-like putative serine protease domain-containing protein [Aminobacter aminovorans]